MILFQNIKSLLQVRDTAPAFVSGAEMSDLPCIHDAYLVIRDGLIHSYGEMKDLARDLTEYDEVIDASGRYILPAWCDSHTHLVYAGNREHEFIARIKGATYAEIAAAGGGILNSGKRLQETSEEDLYLQSKARLTEVMYQGTGAIEIKSGYGFTAEAEMKMLRVARQLGQDHNIPVKTTFLALHAVPAEYKDNKQAYINYMLHDVLPQIKDQGLADYIDAFCETGYFSVDDLRQLLEAGIEYQLPGKVHVNQFTAIGGVQMSAHYDARSVDHLEEMRPEDITSLKGSNTMPVALPGCSYFLSIPYTPAREMIDAGLPLALATDYNPGSAPSGNMNLVVAAACIKMNMTPEEAINAATINGAYAMGLEEEVGSITIDKRANLIMTKELNSYGMIPYSFGSDPIAEVYINGRPIRQTQL